MAKFAWRPIAAGLDKRERGIADQIAQAEAANQKAKEILADYERKLAAAQERSAPSSNKAAATPNSSAARCSTRRRRTPRPSISRAVKQIEAAAAAAVEELADQQRRAGRRAGRQDRPRQAQPARPRPTDRAGRGGVREQNEQMNDEAQMTNDEE